MRRKKSELKVFFPTPSTHLPQLEQSVEPEDRNILPLLPLCHPEDAEQLQRQHCQHIQHKPHRHHVVEQDHSRLGHQLGGCADGSLHGDQDVHDQQIVQSIGADEHYPAHHTACVSKPGVEVGEGSLQERHRTASKKIRLPRVFLHFFFTW